MPSPASANPGPVTHAGGVVYRLVDGRRLYLLVRARTAEPEWVFPKGHIEPGESADAAALREVLEESGVSARIVAPLPDLPIDHRRVAMFLMASEDAEAGKPERATAWLPLAEAHAALRFPESRTLLQLADRSAGAPA